MSQIGVIARADASGLGNQTRNIVQMLNPSKVLVVDSSPFNGAAQNFQWYDDYLAFKSMGFPTSRNIVKFLQGLTHIITCETAYNDALYSLARTRNVKSYCQPNFEFSDHWNKSLPQPDLWFMPSYWMLEEWTAKFPNTIYMPPPLNPLDFKAARDVNFERTGKRKFLHVVGKWATADRNGTLSILQALEYSRGDYELVITSQQELPAEVLNYSQDARVRIQTQNLENPQDLYKDYDALILPRRYGGLCLPMNEALMSGMPVIMTDALPNSRILPQDWLVPVQHSGTLHTRMELNLFSAQLYELGRRLDWLTELTDVQMQTMKTEAFDLGYTNYAASELKPKYMKAMEL